MEIIIVATFDEVRGKYSVQHCINNCFTLPIYLTYNEINKLTKELQERYPNAKIDLDIY